MDRINVRTLCAFEGREGFKDIGDVFDAEAGYAKELLAGKLVEATGDVPQAQPTDERPATEQAGAEKALSGAPENRDAARQRSKK